MKTGSVYTAQENGNTTRCVSFSKSDNPFAFINKGWAELERYYMFKCQRANAISGSYHIIMLDYNDRLALEHNVKAGDGRVTTHTGTYEKHIWTEGCAGYMDTYRLDDSRNETHTMYTMHPGLFMKEYAKHIRRDFMKNAEAVSESIQRCWSACNYTESIKINDRLNMLKAELIKLQLEIESLQNNVSEMKEQTDRLIAVIKNRLYAGESIADDKETPNGREEY